MVSFAQQDFKGDSHLSYGFGLLSFGLQVLQTQAENSGNGDECAEMLHFCDNFLNF